MTGSEIRKKFLDYFAARGHRVVRSSSLVPANDPTLLFTNAGMNQFKDVFLGLDHRDYVRAASSQKCVRAGGKHNDLENVGRTARHHTFFEMLGNFSFGDYFKKEAIEFAWELVTQEYKLSADKLYVTVFEGNPALSLARDEDAATFWLRVGVAPDRIIDRGMADNFWAMGDTGPCGPCSEIHYDLGPAASDEGHKDCAFPCECGRYVEIWNLVFMQFNRDASGKLSPLPRPCVDTGMGLERIAAVIQGKLSNFDTDLLFPLIEEATQLSGVAYGDKHDTDVSLRILADHSRAAAFLVHDGVLPSNEGRGYVLRKILRRAARHGKLLGLKDAFLFQLTGKVAELMADAFPELLDSTTRVAAVVKSEEHRFSHTMTVALQEYEKMVKEATASASGTSKATGVGATVKGATASTSGSSTATATGEKLFRLYDTFGMPWDWMEELANERGLILDRAGFDEAMRRQQERARASWKGVSKEVLSPVYSEVLKKGRTVFEGYQQTASRDCYVLAILRDGVLVENLSEGARAELVLDHTPFYAEAGGQVGDSGSFLDEATQEVIATVEDTYSPVSGLIAHRIVSRSPIRVGDRLTAVVDDALRNATRRNHTGTHLLHAALRQILGTHVKQAGSVVEPDRLRFDFSHFAPVSDDELQEIERLANEAILKNTSVQTEVLDLDQALESGAMAFFGEKYPDRVRVVSVPGFSKELCGGTHVSRTGDIGLLKVTSESSISAGVRRIEAVTGEKALEQFQTVTSMILSLSSSLKTSPADLSAMVEKMAESQKNLEKQLEAAKMKIAQAQIAEVDNQVRLVKDIKVLALRIDSLERNQMRTLADVLRQKLKSGVIVLGSSSDGKVALITAITADLTKRLHAGRIAQAVAERLGGTGGGRPDIAEAGGKNPALLDTTLKDVYEIVAGML